MSGVRYLVVAVELSRGAGASPRLALAAAQVQVGRPASAAHLLAPHSRRGCLFRSSGASPRRADASGSINHAPPPRPRDVDVTEFL